MKTFLKQLKAWGTELKYNVFWRARIFLALIIFILAVGGVSAYHFMLHFYEGRMCFWPNCHLIEMISDLFAELRRLPFYIYAIVTSMGLVVGYFVSGLALRSAQSVFFAQRRFIDDAAHELRTPLSVLKANTEVALLGGKEQTIGDLRGALNSNLEEIDRMSKIIKSLLSIVRIDGARSQTPFHKIDLAEVASGILKSLAPLAEKKGVLFFASRLEHLWIWGDETALEEMVTNLVRNAIEHTPKKGKIEMRVAQSGKNVELSIRDTGSGIPPNEVKQIFEPFYRGEGKAVSTVGGHAGLGLAIVQRVVKMHKGSIDVKSSLGNGTAVKVGFVMA